MIPIPKLPTFCFPCGFCWHASRQSPLSKEERETVLLFADFEVRDYDLAELAMFHDDPNRRWNLARLALHQILCLRPTRFERLVRAAPFIDLHEVP